MSEADARPAEADASASSVLDFRADGPTPEQVKAQAPVARAFIFGHPEIASALKAVDALIHRNLHDENTNIELRLHVEFNEAGLRAPTDAMLRAARDDRARLLVDRDDRLDEVAESHAKYVAILSSTIASLPPLDAGPHASPRGVRAGTFSGTGAGTGSGSGEAHLPVVTPALRVALDAVFFALGERLAHLGDVASERRQGILAARSALLRRSDALSQAAAAEAGGILQRALQAAKQDVIAQLAGAGAAMVVGTKRAVSSSPTSSASAAHASSCTTATAAAESMAAARSSLFPAESDPRWLPLRYQAAIRASLPDADAKGGAAGRQGQESTSTGVSIAKGGLPLGLSLPSSGRRVPGRDELARIELQAAASVAAASAAWAPAPAAASPGRSQGSAGTSSGAVGAASEGLASPQRGPVPLAVSLALKRRDEASQAAREPWRRALSGRPLLLAGPSDALSRPSASAPASSSRGLLTHDARPASGATADDMDAEAGPLAGIRGITTASGEVVHDLFPTIDGPALMAMATQGTKAVAAPAVWSVAAGVAGPVSARRQASDAPRPRTAAAAVPSPSLSTGSGPSVSFSPAGAPSAVAGSVDGVASSIAPAMQRLASQPAAHLRMQPMRRPRTSAAGPLSSSTSSSSPVSAFGFAPAATRGATAGERAATVGADAGAGVGVAAGSGASTPGFSGVAPRMAVTSRQRGGAVHTTASAAPSAVARTGKRSSLALAAAGGVRPVTAPEGMSPSAATASSQAGPRAAWAAAPAAASSSPHRPSTAAAAAGASSSSSSSSFSAATPLETVAAAVAPAGSVAGPAATPVRSAPGPFSPSRPAPAPVVPRFPKHDDLDSTLRCVVADPQPSRLTSPHPLQLAAPLPMDPSEPTLEEAAFAQAVQADAERATVRRVQDLWCTSTEISAYAAAAAAASVDPNAPRNVNVIRDRSGVGAGLAAFAVAAGASGPSSTSSQAIAASGSGPVAAAEGEGEEATADPARVLGFGDRVREGERARLRAEGKITE